MAKTKEEMSQYNKEYRLKNKESLALKRSDYTKKYAKENKKKLNEKSLKWYHLNKEKIKQKMKEYQSKNKDILLIKGREREFESRRNLDDRILKQMLIRQGFSRCQITPELIELKRITLKTTRLCRQLKN